MPYTETDFTINAVKDYWQKSDCLFHSEVGVPGAQSAEMFKKYCGKYTALPANETNPLWMNSNWWFEWKDFLRDHKGKTPTSINKYVEWSQQRQKEGLSIALKSCKDKFPACGGFIIWMGHDSYPCPVYTSFIDFDGNLKPVAKELEKIFKDNKNPIVR